MLQIQYDGIIFKEGRTYVSYCPELDVSSCGNNIDEARNNLKMAVSLFIEEAENMGTLEDILDEAGYELKESDYWEAPRIVATELMSTAC
ncbi:MAG: type II toxin-antitoxin system HicB family antitoxin [Candidatus Aminicenantes bacterium]|jgi:predicted RNase H-like HicB family nuclease|nr:type II toxin-antitoxin system HicB family antitoxin [Candidatus Aminicenantes bacterium]